MHTYAGLLLALAATANAYVAPGAMPLAGMRKVRPRLHPVLVCSAAVVRLDRAYDRIIASSVQVYSARRSVFTVSF